MRKKQAFKLLGYALLSAALLLTLVIVACGGDDDTPEPAPSTPAATTAPTAPPTAPPAMTPTAMPSTPAMTPAPTAMPSTPRPTPVATARPTPRPTATPTPTPTATMAPKVPVSPRLKVSKVPPGAQVTMMWKTFTSETGPMKPMYEFIINTNRFNSEYENTMLAEDWSMAHRRHELDAESPRRRFPSTPPIPTQGRTLPPRTSSLPSRRRAGRTPSPQAASGVTWALRTRTSTS